MNNLIEQPYWWRAAPRPKLPQQLLPRQADVAIVGSGLTGLVAALHLARAGRHVIVLEAGEIGGGASSRNAGYVGRTFKYSFGELRKAHGLAYAVRLYRELQAAFDSVGETIASEGIGCFFRRQGRFIMAAGPKQYDALAREFDLRWRYLHEPFEPVSRADQQRELASDIYYGGVVIEDLAGLHPALYHQGLVKAAQRQGAELLAHMRVTAIRRKENSFDLDTRYGVLNASDVVIATNGYTAEAVPWLRKCVVPFDAYMIATESLPPVLIKRLTPGDRTFIDWNFNVDFLRRAPDGERILYGGLTGTRGVPLAKMAQRLKERLVRILPDLANVALEHVWTGRCAGTRDLYPHLGVYQGMHYAMGYCFAGVPMGTYFGIKLARRILGQSGAETIFADRPMKPFPLYSGNPWFLPFAMRWMSRHDNQ